MAIILGINAFHPDAAACVLRDGLLIAAVAEERLGKRLKHVACFPARAIQTVLQMAGVTIKEVHYVALGHDNNANLRAKVGFVVANPLRSAASVLLHFGRRRQMRSLAELLAEECGFDAADCRFETVMVEHHLAHLSSAYFASPFDEAAGFSYDGSGDFVSAMYGRCQGNSIEVLDRVFVPHSLGFFYTAICQFIGFERFGEEYKVMGLSAYGQPSYLEVMREMLTVTSDGRYRLNLKYFSPPAKGMEKCVAENGEILLPPLYSKELERRLGSPRRRGQELSRRDKDLACSCQAHFEDVVLECVNRLHARVPSKNLITAGGCALNGVCNARILRDTPFQRAYIQCAASDDGTCIGAALYVWHVHLKQPRRGTIDHAYYGPEYPEQAMETALRAAGLSYARHAEPALLDATAGHLNAGRIVGWYQGRSEWGPRALGNRSILAHPGWPGMKDLINQKIKRREPFRPFAPTILAEEVPNYFEQNVESPFMMHVVKIRPEKRAALAAVCHEDHTGRLHTVQRSQNRLYYDLIKTFQRRSGVPVLLNTSFNENEPIVDTPEQAIRCFTRNDIDVLCLGPFMVTKSNGEGSPPSEV